MKNLRKFLEEFKGARVLMAIYPHPDDETVGAGGLLLLAKKLGYRTILLTLTKGAEGGCEVGFGGEKLKKVREVELARAVKHLKVDELVLGDFDDGLLKHQQGKWEKWLEQKLQKYSPGIVVTYDHSGMYGHPDHIVLSLVLKKLIEKIGSKDRPTLLWTSFAGMTKARLVHQKVREWAQGPSLQTDLGLDAVSKWRAMRAHVSQKMGKNLPVPLLLVCLIFRQEWYHLVDFSKTYPHKYVEWDYITEILKREGIKEKI